MQPQFSFFKPLLKCHLFYKDWLAFAPPPTRVTPFLFRAAPTVVHPAALTQYYYNWFSLWFYPLFHISQSSLQRAWTICLPGLNQVPQPGSLKEQHVCLTVWRPEVRDKGLRKVGSSRGPRGSSVPDLLLLVILPVFDLLRLLETSPEFLPSSSHEVFPVCVFPSVQISSFF